MLTQERCEAYIRILEEELHTATGCTEPIAIAYCAAKLRALLGKQPERILAEVSGNILKNVKSVVVPNTGGQKGIRAAICTGIVAGRAEREPRHPTDAGYPANRLCGDGPGRGPYC